MENSLHILVVVALVAAVAIFLIVRFSQKENRGENLIRFALLCVGLGVVFTLISAWISGEKDQLYKLSGPVIIPIIALAARRRKRNNQNQALASATIFRNWFFNFCFDEESAVK